MKYRTAKHRHFKTGQVFYGIMCCEGDYCPWGVVTNEFGKPLMFESKKERDDLLRKFQKTVNA